MKKIMFAIFVLVFGQAALAQSLTSSLLPTDARSMALGGMDVPCPTDGIDVRLSFGKWAPYTSNSTIAGVKISYARSGRFVAGLDLSSIKGQQYNISNESGTVKELYSPSDTYFGVFGELSFNESFYGKAEIKGAVSNIGNNASGFSVLGILKAGYRSAGLDAGVSLQAGGPISYGGPSYSTPLVVKAEASYSVSSLTGLCELGYEAVSGTPIAGIGAQYKIKDIIGIQAGYHFGKVVPSFLSLGIGASYRGISINAAYLLLNKDLGNSFMLTLGCNF